MPDRFRFRAILAGMAAVAVLVPVSGTAQRRPDLSGHWVLVTATTAGGRTKEKPGTPKASGEVPTTSTTPRFGSAIPASGFRLLTGTKFPLRFA